MRDIVEIHEFFVQGTDTDRSHVLLHISEPSADEENKGYFFALCEIIDGSEHIISHVQKMIDDVEANYYDIHNEQEKNAFEQSIEYINRRSHHLLQDKIAELNLLFGVIENNKISFASRGPTNAYLVYHKGTELHHVPVNEEKKIPEDQIFSSLVEGEIRVDDYFVISTSSVEKYFSIDRIEKILIQKDTKGSSLHIQKTLEQVKSESPLCGILIHRPREEDLPKFSRLPKIARPIQSSLPAAKTLFASTLSSISKRLSKNTSDNGIFNPQPKALLEQEKPHRGVQKNIPRPIIFIANGISIITVAFVQLVRTLIVWIVKTFRFLFILATNRRGERAQSLNTFRIGLRENFYTFKRLPIFSKILLALCILAILVFVSSILVVRHRDAQQALVTEYNQTVSEIKNKKDLAESKMLYQDTENAFAILQEAKNLLGTLETNPKKDSVELQTLSLEIEHSLGLLRKETTPTANVKADIGAQFGAAQTDRLVRLDNTLVAFGSGEKNYYFINLDTGAVVQKNHDTIPSLLSGNAPKEYDKIVFTIDPNQIAEYDKTTDSLSTKEIGFPSENVNIQDIFVYNRKLYTLDTQGGQIYRHNQTQTGYDKGTAWITDVGVDIKNAASITIDGDVYVLKNNGQVIKLSAGKVQPFSLNALDPALTNPTQIWTYNDVKNIYILEPSTKRVVVLDKNGTLIKQYTSSNWVNPESMIVDEARNTVYILDSNKIYSFPL